LYSGRKSAGEAATDTAIGVGSGLLLKGAGGALVRHGRRFAPDVNPNTVLVRHHTDKAGISGIRNDSAINPSRPSQGQPAGVHFEIEPFGNPKTAAARVGAKDPASKSFVEFNLSKSKITKTPAVGSRNTGMVTTDKPLPINKKKTTFKRR